MEARQAQEDIRLIKEMIEKTKKTAAESGKYFILWTIVPILAILGMYILTLLKNYQWIWLNWVVFIAIGIIITAILEIRRESKDNVKTYIQIAVFSVWNACGFAFILLGFIFPWLGLYSYQTIPVMMSMIAGIGVYATGGITEWNLLKWCGVLWWFGALLMVMVDYQYRTLLIIPLLVFGYLLPGIILNRNYRQKGVHDA